MNKDKILIFKIVLNDIKPAIWRRIAVPATYSFWDLHVAIQDAMGWTDSHLHRFRLKTKKGEVQIGIPDEDAFVGDPEILPGWKIKVAPYFRKPRSMAIYEYDFGDGWEHTVVLEELTAKEEGVKYPQCLDGARACPPEDCGGSPGYEELVKVFANPRHREYKSMVKWLGKVYDPESFFCEDVCFDDPKERLKNLEMNS